MEKEEKKNEIVIYTTPDGQTKVEVVFDGETVWLPQSKIVDLFQSSKSNISEHIKRIFADGELDKEVVVRKYRTTTPHGAMQDKTQSHEVDFYNLDMILAIGYRVNSARGIAFRKWASNILTEYMKKGFAMNDEKLKNLGGGLYWKELLERIRDIRASEKVMYRQVLDLYATSIDYNPQSDETVKFFKIVQAKLHYASTGYTASEIVFNRANAELPFMGLTVFKGNHPARDEAMIAKDYLTETELKSLRRLVNSFFDFAEHQAERHNQMFMKNWVEILDTHIKNYGEQVLTDGGTISEIDAYGKAEIKI
ncbi:MAG: virulence RhuM family protein [Christensenellaceae bacterium]|jgi:hypothetical protein|nr:virulence RhuM family protein [Christensenellaceae bacterium]